MENVLSELPLALFSTFAPMGAGAFVILAAAFATCKFDATTLKKIDRFTTIPVAFVGAGFLASFFHLANPLNALGVFAGVGSSPLSNELVAGVLFFAAMAAYWACAISGKLAPGARKGFSAAVAALGIVFAAFIGMAYMIETIPGWNSFAGPAQIVGFALAGGAALGVLVLAFAGGASALKTGNLKTAVIAISAAGIVLAVGGVAAQAASVKGLSNALLAGTEVVAEIVGIIAAGAVCLVATGIFDAFAVGKGGEGTLTRMSATAAFLAVAGILMLRLAFYAMGFSVGLNIM